MEFEPVQKANPYKLTIKQHVFPAVSINRFSADTGKVDVFMMEQQIVRSLAPKDKYFCALRAWDQKSEAGYGKKIEDRFQELAESIISGRVKTIGLLEKFVVEEFFALWRARRSFKHNRQPDLTVRGITGDSISVDEQERLENHYVMFFRGGVLPGRFVAGINTIRYIDMFIEANRNMRWGIVRAGEGEFLVPDGFADMMIVPVTPSISLMADRPDGVIGRREVAIANRVAIERSAQYYFARDFSCCPVI